jgi:hypothetical protein
VEGAWLVRRRGTAWLLALALATAGLAGCGGTGEHPDVGAPIDKARECADLLGELTGLDFDPKAGVAKLDQTVRRLDQAIKHVDSGDVRRAANELLLRVRRLRDAVRDADPAKERRAVREVTEAAKRLARTCGVPVDRVTGNG